MDFKDQLITNFNNGDDHKPFVNSINEMNLPDNERQKFIDSYNSGDRQTFDALLGQYNSVNRKQNLTGDSTQSGVSERNPQPVAPPVVQDKQEEPQKPKETKEAPKSPQDNLPKEEQRFVNEKGEIVDGYGKSTAIRDAKKMQDYTSAFEERMKYTSDYPDNRDSWNGDMAAIHRQAKRLAQIARYDEEKLNAFYTDQYNKLSERYPETAKQISYENKKLEDELKFFDSGLETKVASYTVGMRKNTEKRLAEIEKEKAEKIAAIDQSLPIDERLAKEDAINMSYMDEEWDLNSNLDGLTFENAVVGATDMIVNAAKSFTAVGVKGYNALKETLTKQAPIDPRTFPAFEGYSDEKKNRLISLYEHDLKNFDRHGRTGMFNEYSTMMRNDFTEEGYGPELDSLVDEQGNPVDVSIVDNLKEIRDAFVKDPTTVAASLAMESGLDPQFILGLVYSTATGGSTSAATIIRFNKILRNVARSNNTLLRNMAKAANSPAIKKILKGSRNLAVKVRKGRLTPVAKAASKQSDKMSMGVALKSRVDDVKDAITYVKEGAKATKVGKAAIGTAKVAGKVDDALYNLPSNLIKGTANAGASMVKEGVIGGAAGVVMNEALEIKKDWLQTFKSEAVEEGLFDGMMNSVGFASSLINNTAHSHYRKKFEKTTAKIQGLQKFFEEAEANPELYNDEAKVDGVIKTVEEIGDEFLNDGFKSMVSLLADYNIYRNGKNSTYIDEDLNEYTDNEVQGMWFDLGPSSQKKTSLEVDEFGKPISTDTYNESPQVAREIRNKQKELGLIVDEAMDKRSKAKARDGLIFISPEAFENKDFTDYLRKRIGDQAFANAYREHYEFVNLGIQSTMADGRVNTKYNENLLAESWDKIKESDNPELLFASAKLFMNNNYNPENFNSFLKDIENSVTSLESTDISKIRENIEARATDSESGKANIAREQELFAKFMKNYSYSRAVLSGDIESSFNAMEDGLDLGFYHAFEGELNSEFKDRKALIMGAAKTGFKLDMPYHYGHITKHPGLARQENMLSGLKNTMEVLAHHKKSLKDSQLKGREEKLNIAADYQKGVEAKIDSHMDRISGVIAELEKDLDENANLYDNFLKTTNNSDRQKVKEAIHDKRIKFEEAYDRFDAYMEEMYMDLAPEFMTDPNMHKSVVEIETNNPEVAVSNFADIFKSVSPLNESITIPGSDGKTGVVATLNPDGSYRMVINRGSNEIIYNVSSKGIAKVADKEKHDVPSEFEREYLDAEGNTAITLNLPAINASARASFDPGFEQIRKSFDLEGYGAVENDIAESFHLARRTYYNGNAEGHKVAMQSLHGKLSRYYNEKAMTESHSKERFIRKSYQAVREYRRALMLSKSFKPEIINVTDPSISAKLDRSNPDEPKIIINRDRLKEMYAEKAWRYSRDIPDELDGNIIIDNSKPLQDEMFDSYQSFEDFVVQHEFSHSLYPREDFFSDFGRQHLAKYEDEVNKRAIEMMNDGFNYNAGDLDNPETLPQRVLEKYRGYIFLDKNHMPQVVTPEFLKGENNKVGRSFRAHLNKEIAEGKVSAMATDGADVLLPYNLKITGQHYTPEMVMEMAQNNVMMRVGELSNAYGENTAWLGLAQMKFGTEPHVRIRQSKSADAHSTEGYEQHLVSIYDFVDYMNNPIGNPKNMQVDLAGTHHSPVIPWGHPKTADLLQQGQITNKDHYLLTEVVANGGKINNPRKVNTEDIPIGAEVILDIPSYKTLGIPHQKKFKHEIVNIGGVPHSVFVNTDVEGSPISVPTSHLESVYLPDYEQNRMYLTTDQKYSTDFEQEADPLNDANMELYQYQEEMSLEEQAELQKELDLLYNQQAQAEASPEQEFSPEQEEALAAAEERKALEEQIALQNKQIQTEEDRIPFKQKTKHFTKPASTKGTQSQRPAVNEAPERKSSFKFNGPVSPKSNVQSKVSDGLERTEVEKILTKPTQNLTTKEIDKLASYRTQNDLSGESLEFLSSIFDSLGESGNIGAVADFNPGSGLIFRAIQSQVGEFHQFFDMGNSKNSGNIDMRMRVNEALNGESTHIHREDRGAISFEGGFNVAIATHGPNEVDYRDKSSRYYRKTDGAYYKQKFYGQARPGIMREYGPDVTEQDYINAELRKEDVMSKRRKPEISRKANFNFGQAFDSLNDGGIFIGVIPERLLEGKDGAESRRILNGLTNRGDVLVNKHFDSVFAGGEPGAIVVVRKDLTKDKSKNTYVDAPVFSESAMSHRNPAIKGPRINQAVGSNLNSISTYLGSTSHNQTTKVLKMLQKDMRVGSPRMNYNIRSTLPDISIRAKGSHFIPPSTGDAGTFDQLNGKKMYEIARKVIKSAERRGDESPLVEINLDAQSDVVTVKPSSYSWPVNWGFGLDGSIPEGMAIIDAYTGQEIKDPKAKSQIAEYVNSRDARLPNSTEMDLGDGSYHNGWSPVVIRDAQGNIQSVLIGQRVVKGGYHRILAKTFEKQGMRVGMAVGKDVDLDQIKKAAESGAYDVVVTDDANKLNLDNYRGGTRISNTVSDLNEYSDGIGVIKVDHKMDEAMVEEISARHQRLNEKMEQFRENEPNQEAGRREAIQVPHMLTELITQKDGISERIANEIKVAFAKVEDRMMHSEEEFNPNDATVQDIFNDLLTVDKAMFDLVIKDMNTSMAEMSQRMQEVATSDNPQLAEIARPLIQEYEAAIDYLESFQEARDVIEELGDESFRNIEKYNNDFVSYVNDITAEAFHQYIRTYKNPELKPTKNIVSWAYRVAGDFPGLNPMDIANFSMAWFSDMEFEKGADKGKALASTLGVVYRSMLDEARVALQNRGIETGSSVSAKERTIEFGMRVFDRNNFLKYLAQKNKEMNEKIASREEAVRKLGEKQSAQDVEKFLDSESYHRDRANRQGKLEEELLGKEEDSDNLQDKDFYEEFIIDKIVETENAIKFVESGWNEDMGIYDAMGPKTSKFMNHIQQTYSDNKGLDDLQSVYHMETDGVSIDFTNDLKSIVESLRGTARAMDESNVQEVIYMFAEEYADDFNAMFKTEEEVADFYRESEDFDLDEYYRNLEVENTNNMAGLLEQTAAALGQKDPEQLDMFGNEEGFITPKTAATLGITSALGLSAIAMSDDENVINTVGALAAGVGAAVVGRNAFRSYTGMRDYSMESELATPSQLGVFKDADGNDTSLDTYQDEILAISNKTTAKLFIRPDSIWEGMSKAAGLSGYQLPRKLKALATEKQAYYGRMIGPLDTMLRSMSKQHIADVNTAFSNDQLRRSVLTDEIHQFLGRENPATDLAIDALEQNGLDENLVNMLRSNPDILTAVHEMKRLEVGLNTVTTSLGIRRPVVLSNKVLNPDSFLSDLGYGRSAEFGPMGKGFDVERFDNVLNRASESLFGTEYGKLNDNQKTRIGREVYEAAIGTNKVHKQNISPLIDRIANRLFDKNSKARDTFVTQSVQRSNFLFEDEASQATRVNKKSVDWGEEYTDTSVDHFIANARMSLNGVLNQKYFGENLWSLKDHVEKMTRAYKGTEAFESEGFAASDLLGELAKELSTTKNEIMDSGPIRDKDFHKNQRYSKFVTAANAVQHFSKIMMSMTAGTVNSTMSIASTMFASGGLFSGASLKALADVANMKQADKEAVRMVMEDSNLDENGINRDLLQSFYALAETKFAHVWHKSFMENDPFAKKVAKLGTRTAASTVGIPWKVYKDLNYQAYAYSFMTGKRMLPQIIDKMRRTPPEKRSMQDIQSLQRVFLKEEIDEMLNTGLVSDYNLTRMGVAVANQVNGTSIRKWDKPSWMNTPTGNAIMLFRKTLVGVAGNFANQFIDPVVAEYSVKSDKKFRDKAGESAKVAGKLITALAGVGIVDVGLNYALTSLSQNDFSDQNREQEMTEIGRWISYLLSKSFIGGMGIPLVMDAVEVGASNFVADFALKSAGGSHYSTMSNLARNYEDIPKFLGKEFQIPNFFRKQSIYDHDFTTSGVKRKVNFNKQKDPLTNLIDEITGDESSLIPGMTESDVQKSGLNDIFEVEDKVIRSGMTRSKEHNNRLMETAKTIANGLVTGDLSKSQIKELERIGFSQKSLNFGATIMHASRNKAQRELFDNLAGLKKRLALGVYEKLSPMDLGIDDLERIINGSELDDITEETGSAFQGLNRPGGTWKGF